MTATNPYDELLEWQKVLDSMPRERWVHLRQIEDWWEVLESGEAPPAWKELSFANSLFRIAFHNEMEVGDRFIILEQAWEVQPDLTLARVELAACSICGSKTNDHDATAHDIAEAEGR